MNPDEVLLSLPGAADYLRLARLAAADTAARAGLTVDEIEDLRIAVDELCHALTDGDGERRLDLCYRIRASRVEVQGTCENPTPEFALSDLAATILGAVVDVYEIALDGDRRTFRLEKTSAGS